MSETIELKEQRLLEILQHTGRIVVAFSGGVDSSLVAKAAVLATGDQAHAVIADSPSLPIGALDEAREIAALIGIPLQILKTTEFDKEEYLQNAGDRCYYCKETLYESIHQHSAELAFDVIVNGTNTDDLGDYRPGLQAATDFAVRSPLVEAGFSKQDVRELAQLWELPVWDKPAAPCLSSRIAYGLNVTMERVRRVDQAERFLKQTLGLRELRVRHEHHDLARIEVPLEALPRLVEEPVRLDILRELNRLGFRYITIDLAGFRSGSMNAVIPLSRVTSTE